MGEISNNEINHMECRLHDSDINNNLITFKPKFLPTPKLHYYNNTNETVTKKIPPKEKGSEAKGTLKRNQLKRRHLHYPIRLWSQNQYWPTQTPAQRAHISG